MPSNKLKGSEGWEVQQSKNDEEQQLAFRSTLNDMRALRKSRKKKSAETEDFERGPKLLCQEGEAMYLRHD